MGTIESYIGSFRNPEELAYGRSGLPPCPLYRVRIHLSHLFDDYSGSTTDTLLVEVYEHWLARVEPMARQPVADGSDHTGERNHRTRTKKGLNP